ncbi:DUF4382 domain-containing protein [Marinobacter sp. CHS3-4]|uniref:DUF4382 domain-containing protein n=1 Tax=Marinobacter sp. CHS3-4 TaxID=3045174 RepID=UPI0024B5F2F7|nr:DUF4382 domain-containing protein [Marinobacter sp. CHS3-4]MDI9246595.1 DUF4382 domain-containing protein [Marinobacter sp. CHS3-4]
MPRILNYLLPLSMAATLAACGGDGSSTGPGTGSVSLNLTDAPTTEFSEVNITFTGVTLKPKDGERIEISFEEAKTLDLLTLQGGETASLLDEVEVPAGDYNWIRLQLDMDPLKTYVMQDGGQKSLFIPSGAQTGLKLIRGFTVAEGGQSGFTVDFDVRKSIVDPKGGQADYYLKPVLRIVDNLSVGSITGEVDYANINSSRMDNPDLANCTEGYAGAIYVYEGEVENPTDLNVNEPDSGPLLVVPVEENLETGLYDYTAAFLTEGTYTISYTCEADNNETSEDLLFQGTQQVPVIANAETTAKTIPIVE